jgi:hypothetical protein
MIGRSRDGMRKLQKCSASKTMNALADLACAASVADTDGI